MATKNLYETDSVAATLLYAISEGKVQLATQTARELHASQETELLWKLLTLAWIFADPSADCEKHRADAFLTGKAGVLLAALLLVPIPIPELPTESKLAPPKYGSRHPPPKWSAWPEGWTAEQAGALWCAVDSATYWERQYRLCAPLLSSAPTALQELLRARNIPNQFLTLLESTIFLPLSHRILMHLFAAQKASPGGAPPKPVLLALSEHGRRARTFCIAPEALAKWNVRSKPAERLIGRPEFVLEDPSQFWCALAEKYKPNAALEFPTEEAQEAFYVEGFPDDIPDEWSAAERAKSHGIAPAEGIQKLPWTPAFLFCWS